MSHKILYGIAAALSDDVTVTLNANDHREWSANGEVISSTVRVRKPDR